MKKSILSTLSLLFLFSLSSQTKDTIPEYTPKCVAKYYHVEGRNVDSRAIPPGYEVGTKKFVIPVAISNIIGPNAFEEGQDGWMTIDQLVSAIPSFNSFMGPHAEGLLEYVLPRRNKDNMSDIEPVHYYGDSLISGGQFVEFHLDEDHELLPIFENTPNTMFANSIAVFSIEEVEGYIGVAWNTNGGALPFHIDYDVSLASLYGNNDFTVTFYPALEESKKLAAHEFFHHLAQLSHTFDSNCAETDSVNGGDLCADTPRTLWASNCNPEHTLCAGVTNDFASTKNIMSYSHACKDTITYLQFVKAYRYVEQYQKLLTRSPAALWPDSCDAGSPYHLAAPGVVINGNNIGVELSWRSNGYAIDYAGTIDWNPKFHIRGREVGTAQWYNFVFDKSAGFKYSKVIFGVEDGVTYEWQIRTSTADGGQPDQVLLDNATPWSELHTFTFNAPQQSIQAESITRYFLAVPPYKEVLYKDIPFETEYIRWKDGKKKRGFKVRF